MTKAMLNTPFELPNVPTPILARVNPIPMALTIRPLSGVDIPGVKPIHAKPVPQALAVTPTVATPTCPSLNPIAIILAIDPIPLVPPTPTIIIHPTPRTLPSVKLPLVNVAVSEHLHPAPRRHALLRLRPRPDRPEHRQRGRGARHHRRRRLQPDGAEREREGEVEREHERGGERDGGEKVKEEGPRDEEVEVERRDGEEEQRALPPHAPQRAERGALGGDGYGEEGGVVGLEERRRRRRRLGERGSDGLRRRRYVDLDLGVEVVAVVGVLVVLLRRRGVEIGRDAYAFFSDLKV